jgi:hypothetical protein
MKTIIILLVAAAVVFIAGAIGCVIGELLVKSIKKIFKL